jgi:hypothetical protein
MSRHLINFFKANVIFRCRDILIRPNSKPPWGCPWARGMQGKQGEEQGAEATHTGVSQTISKIAIPQAWDSRLGAQGPRVFCTSGPCLCPCRRLRLPHRNDAERGKHHDGYTTVDAFAELLLNAPTFIANFIRSEAAAAAAAAIAGRYTMVLNDGSAQTVLTGDVVNTSTAEAMIADRQRRCSWL